MVSTQSIRLHSKCLEILEMIKECNNRISRANSDLHFWDNSKGYSTVRILYSRTHFEEIVKKYEAIKERLVLYYTNQLLLLVQIPVNHFTNNKNKANEHTTSGNAAI